MKIQKLIGVLVVAIMLVQCTPKTAKIDKSPAKPGLISAPNSAVLDRTQMPKAGPAPKIQLGKYENFTLANGLEVIVVKNTKIPAVSFQLSLDNDPMMEGDKAGMVGLVGGLLRTGTKNKTKSEIDAEVDFLGATLSTNSGGMFARSLTRHKGKLLTIMKDVLTGATIPKDEFDKAVKQTMSGLASNKTDPDAMSANLVNALRYGKNHPYGEITTEETLKNVTRQDVENYYKTYFKPNNAYLVIVGDITSEEAKALSNDFFGDWKKGNVPSNKYDNPSAPMGTQVAVVDKPGAVQSVINITYPIEYTPGNPDAIKASVMNTILGGSFSGRMNQNLREDKGYTYGARTGLRTNKLVGSFSSSASVRNAVTDSAVAQMLIELNKISAEPVSQKDLDFTKKQMSGNFALALESPQTVARYALNIKRYNLPQDYYETYLEKLNAVTIEDVQAMAKKYVRPGNAYITVVGNKDEIADKLTQFAPSGKVNFYDNYGNPVVASAATIPAGLTGANVVDKYLEAIGGAKKLKTVMDQTITLKGEMQGRPLVMQMMNKRPNKVYMNMNMMGMTVMEQGFDGTSGKQKGMNGEKELEGKELDDLKEGAVMFEELYYTERKYKMVLKGIEKVSGEDAYKVEIIKGNGDKQTDLYSVASGLKLQEISTAEGPQGPMAQITTFSDYKTVDGVKFAHTLNVPLGPQGIEMKVTELKLNTGLLDDQFTIK